jgi:hypothetical protein
MPKQRQTYEGPVEIWVDGIKRFDLTGKLSCWTDPAGTVVSWDGLLEGLSQHNRLELTGRPLELRLANERSSTVVMSEGSDAVRGVGPVPF